MAILHCLNARLVQCLDTRVGDGAHPVRIYVSVPGGWQTSLTAFIAAFYAYGAALPDEAVTGGIYRYSRNPMYFAFHLGMLAVCIASTSLWLLIVIVPFFVFTHLTILGEERYCEATYGETYRAYKAKTPRYFLIG